MAFVIGVVHQRQVETARRAGLVAFSHGRESAVRGLSPGDKVIYYAPRTDRDGVPVQAFIAHATVTGTEARQHRWPDTDYTAWVREAAFDDVTPVAVRPLLETLSFVKDPRRWGLTFRGGKFSIPAEDYRRIAGALLGGTG